METNPSYMTHLLGQCGSRHVACEGVESYKWSILLEDSYLKAQFVPRIKHPLSPLQRKVYCQVMKYLLHHVTITRKAQIPSCICSFGCLHGVRLSFAWCLPPPLARPPRTKPDTVHILITHFPLIMHTSYATSSLWRWTWQRVPKRRQNLIWRRGDIQKNIYKIQNTAKIWNQEHKYHVWTKCKGSLIRQQILQFRKEASNLSITRRHTPEKNITTLSSV
jgi:hypothetical protein